MSERIKAFKAFGSGLECHGFRYEEGKEYSQDDLAPPCGEEFHATLMPLHVLRNTSAATLEFREVELTDVVGPENDGYTKVVGKTIRIGAKIDLTELIEAQVEFVFKHAERPVEGGEQENGLAAASRCFGAATVSGEFGAATVSGDCGAATASGGFGAATVSGDWGAAMASEDLGAATASGRSSGATASGDWGAATVSGYRSVATASGYSGAATVSGSYGVAAASGECGVATASARNGAATASGDRSIAFAAGFDGRARATLGNWIVVTERDSEGTILGVQSAKVDGQTIKADTYYVLRGGNLEEA